MTPADFKRKWSRFQGKESSAYQEHFNDLCGLLHERTPAESDPSGADFYCFQKRVVKDLELFELHEDGAEVTPGERGFADVWKNGRFAWEYKGKKKNLEEAYRQLLRYRESLLNPPLLIVCDFDRYIVRTNFNGTVQETYEFTNDQIDRPENLRILRAVFADPDALRPQRTTAQVTEALAETIATVAKSLQKREAVELADAASRAEMNFAQRKNLRIARFLNRMVFCFFAEDTGLLPGNLFTELLRTGLDDLTHFAQTLETLFGVMAKGGIFGKDKIRCFNGHLFEDSTVFELTEDELRKLAGVGEADWQFIQPSIMGTLFERALDEGQRGQIGAHYTSEADIKTLVEPVLMAPLRREWAALKSRLIRSHFGDTGVPAKREEIATFQRKLADMTVLDPACGSGNFLYVSLQLLLDLEKEVITYAAQLGFRLFPMVSVQQLRAIEINPYAFELAQVSVQIGFLQWRRDNGFDNDRSPVLQNLDGFQNEDALLVPHFHSKARTLREAQAREHISDDALKFYTEREWPRCHVILSNPPFLGDKKMKRGLSRTYVNELRRVYRGRLPGSADLCCYWFEKARELIAAGHCSRAGLLATQNIRGGASRKVLDEIKTSGDIFFAISDRDWVLDGAMVHISMVGFDLGSEIERILDGQRVQHINSDLTTSVDVTKAAQLRENAGCGFIGSCKGGPFDISEDEALAMLTAGGNPNGRPNSDIVRPRINTTELTNRRRGSWIIDTRDMAEQEASGYELPFKIIVDKVKPKRDNNADDWLRTNWWRPQRMRPEMRSAIHDLSRFIVTPTTSTHRIFAWLSHPVLPDHKLVVIARADDFSFGILHSKIHEVWSRAVVGTQLREKESGQNYNVDSALGTFPFPVVVEEQMRAVEKAARELNELRERWLNPPEWMRTAALEFPGSLTGPWERYIDPKTVSRDSGVGSVRYLRLEPRDKKSGKELERRTLTNLYNERPPWLDLAHSELDSAVATAYGWPADLTDEQILERLLALNLQRAAEEKEAAKKPRAQRAKADDELL